VTKRTLHHGNSLMRNLNSHIMAWGALCLSHFEHWGSHSLVAKPEFEAFAFSPAVAVIRLPDGANNPCEASPQLYRAS
jgi:hypothetical protein